MSEETIQIEGGDNEAETLQRAELLNSGEYDSANPPEFEELTEEEGEELTEEEGEELTEDESGEDFEAFIDEMSDEDVEALMAELEIIEDDEEGEEEEVEEEGVEALFTDETIRSLNEEYAELGGLSPETVDALVESGIPQPLIDTYLQGLGAIENQQQQMAYDIMGGEEAYNQMVSWAGANMAEADIDAFNSAVGNPAQFRMALEGLKARYESNFGSTTEGMLFGAPNGDGSVYTDTSQLIDAMSDPRYERDAGYRNMVTAKLQRSSLF